VASSTGPHPDPALARNCAVYKEWLSPVLRPVAGNLTSANTERNMPSSVAEEHVPSQIELA
jgi:hypothetical protein